MSWSKYQRYKTNIPTFYMLYTVYSCPACHCTDDRKTDQYDHSIGRIYRLNMELDIQSLFGLHVHSSTHWLRPHIWAQLR
jgi:hypothetical protein